MSAHTLQPHVCGTCLKRFDHAYQLKAHKRSTRHGKTEKQREEAQVRQRMAEYDAKIRLREPAL